MGDEIEGPYKVIARLSPDPRTPTVYAIAVQQKNDLFLRELIPNAGSGDTARKLCNLLNKEHKENLRDSAD